MPVTDAYKPIGGAVDPDVEAERYAKEIHAEGGTEFPEFHRSRVLPDEARANARLIAAAPDLLQMLLTLIQQIEVSEATDLFGEPLVKYAVVGAARDAIAKATGQEVEA